MTQYIGKSRYFSPSQEFQSFFRYNDLKHLLGLIAAQLLLREEEHTHAIFPLSAQLNAKGLCHSFKKLVGHLGQDTDTVTGLAFCIFTGSVLQVFNDFQGIFYGLVTFLTFNIHTGTDTAVIMLKFLPVKRSFGEFILYFKHLLFPPITSLPQVCRFASDHSTLTGIFIHIHKKGRKGAFVRSFATFSCTIHQNVQVVNTLFSF